MSRFDLRHRFLAGAAAILASAALSGPSSAQLADLNAPPDFGDSGWINEGTFNGGGLVEMPGQPYFKQDARYPHVPNNRPGQQPNYWIADLTSNPNVKQWAKDVKIGRAHV